MLGKRGTYVEGMLSYKQEKMFKMECELAELEKNGLYPLKNKDKTIKAICGISGTEYSIPEGELTGYKKCRIKIDNKILPTRSYYAIVTLKIPSTADVFSVNPIGGEYNMFNVKHKTNMAIVEKIEYSKECERLENNHIDIKVVSYHDDNFEYKIGNTVQPKKTMSIYNDMSCGSGIYFFRGKDAATRY